MSCMVQSQTLFEFSASDICTGLESDHNAEGTIEWNHATVCFRYCSECDW